MKSLHIDMTLPTALFVVFLVLKLTDVIAWSWWWVFSPFWIPLLFVGGLLVIFLFLALFGRVDNIKVGAKRR